MTPPNVLGAPKPTSSVMMSRIFGVFFGGTVIAGQQGLDCAALGLISPPKGAALGRRCLVSAARMAPGEQGLAFGC